MTLLLCPNCENVKLNRSRVLASNRNPNSGKEYLSCSRCTSKWFMDDPNRPQAVHVRPKQSIWKTLSTWGAPHNEPDALGVLHPLTYVFPPRHEYPSPFLPTSSTPRQSVLVSESIPAVHPEPTSPAPKMLDQPTSPASKMLEQPASPVPKMEQPASPAPKMLEQPTSPSEPALLPAPSPCEPQADPPPPVEETSIIDQQPQEVTEPHETQTISEELNPSLPKDSQSELHPALSAPEDSDHSEKYHSTPTTVSNMDNEERARYDLLLRIANSPLPPFLEQHRADTYEPSDLQSIHSNDHQLSVPSKASPKSLSPEEERLLKTLLRVATSPCPPIPMAYADHTLSPKLALLEFSNSESCREELDNAAHARRIAERIEHAIQNSPLIPPHSLQSPCSEKGSSSITQIKSPASKCSGLRSSRHSIARSVPATPHEKLTDNQSTTSMPQSPHADDSLPLPGAFPTPKVIPLTKEALSRLGTQSSRSGGSVRSKNLSNSLPVAPRYQNSTRASVTTFGKSALFG